jgi:hypothetical protein
MLNPTRVGLLTAAMLVAFGGQAIASAAPPVDCAKRDAQTGICLVAASSPGEAAGPGPDGSGPDPAAGGPTGGESAPVETCTFTVADPQPMLSHPAWAGHGPEDGAIYLHVCPKPSGFGPGDWIGLVFLANQAAAPAGPPVDPRALARQAIDSMVMHGPEIRMAPPPGSNSAVVGVPVWMWTDRGEHITGLTEASASAGGVTVTAVGQVSEVRWDMGDGHSVACGVGTPYVAGADGPSPDCGYTYATASTRHVPGGGPWPITATSTWTITWSGGGLSGTETLQLSSSAELIVGEVHVLNQDGGGR